MKITTLHPETNPGEEIYPNIVTDNIPTFAVTSAKIANGAITPDKLANRLYEHTIRVRSSTTTDFVFTYISRRVYPFTQMAELLNEHLSEIPYFAVSTIGKDRDYILLGLKSEIASSVTTCRILGGNYVEQVFSSITEWNLDDKVRTIY